MERQDIFHEILRALAIAVLIAMFIAALAVVNQQSAAPIDPDVSSDPPLNDLSAELRRCSTLGPKDAEDARCEAVWGENRRHFFGRPAQPVPPEIERKEPAPANNFTPNPATAGDAP